MCGPGPLGGLHPGGLERHDPGRSRPYRPGLQPGGAWAPVRAEQAGAGLDQCTPEELEAFRSLNDRYKATFGFPYILAVRGRHRTEILADFRARVENAPEAEFAEALEQVRRIALLRIEALADAGAAG